MKITTNKQLSLEKEKFTNFLNYISKQYQKNNVKLFIQDDIKSYALFLTSFLLSSKNLNNSLRSYYINVFKECETLFPSSSFYISKILKNNLDFSSLEKDLIYSKSTFSDYLRILKSINICDENIEKIKEILRFAGSNSQIIVNKSNKSRLCLIKKSESSFNLKLNGFFKSNEKIECISLCIDEFIENSYILNYISEVVSQYNLPKNIVIISRGYTHNIEKIQKEIFLNKKVKFFLYSCLLDNNDPFLFEDLQISLNKETLLSLNNIHEIKNEIIKSEIKSFYLNYDKIVFTPEKNKLFSNLNKKIFNEKSEKYSDYILKRKNRITSNKTYIEVPKKDINLLNDIKTSIVIFNKMSKNGIYKSKSTIKINNTNIIPVDLYYSVIKGLKSIKKLNKSVKLTMEL